MRMSQYIPEAPEREDWDVIVVGTGMGGGTVGYELARLGRRVLFLEKGRLLHGGAAADQEPDPAIAPEADARMRTGRWPLPLEGQTSFGDVAFFAPLGCGSGGTTGLYGAQLERFRPDDFRPRASFPGPEGEHLPEEWPVSHDEMLPWYRRAEALLRVRGTPDPLNPDPEMALREPPPLSPRDEALRGAFEEVGLHPYRSHVGFAYVENCFECADICPLACKSDTGDLCLVPALERYGAAVLPRCEVQDVVVDGDRVTGVRARYRDQDLTLRARAVVLAAGAWATPVLLLNSRSAGRAEGLANRSGQVGRNLMLHTSDFLTVDPGERHSCEGPKKSLALNDFYHDDGRKLGTLQSAGLPIEPLFVQAYLRYADERDPQWWRRFTSPFVPLAARAASHWFGSASLFATIVEDLPNPENRVIPDAGAPNGMRFEYQYTPELLGRNRQFRERVRERLAPRLKTSVVTWGRNNINYGHVCGTCRAGDDPRTSVVNRDNRAHDLENLWISDASFFPSSGGTNPSLTVAANGLRVGGLVDASLA